VSAAIKLRDIDRPGKGTLGSTLELKPKPFVLFTHVNLDGSAGGRLVVLLSEIPTMLDILRSAQQLASAKHRTVSASEVERQLEEDRRLF
jgi:hypothetical protein